MHRIKLKDIKKFFISPIVIDADEPIYFLASTFVQNPERRVIFVKDANGRFAGSVSLKSFIKYLWPRIAATESEEVVSLELFRIMKATQVSDLVLNQDVFLKNSSTLEDAVLYLEDKNIDALPVLDDDNNIIGEVNHYNVLEAYIYQNALKGELLA